MNEWNRDNNQRYNRRNFLELAIDLNLFNKRSQQVSSRINERFVSDIKYQESNRKAERPERVL